MQRIDTPTAATTLPTPAATSAPGYFTGGNPATGVAATVLTADWANSIQEELMSVLAAAGVPAAKATNNQVLTALQAMFGGVVGSMRNASMVVAAAAAIATFTADEIIIESALGGIPFRLANYSETINLATTGAGGMDTGAAPVSGYVALYAIYNPTTGTASILATNATAAAAPAVYAGGHMPAGYTASALISAWPTNGSGQLIVGLQRDRSVLIQSATALTTSTTQASPTSLSIASIVPPNARTVSGQTQATSTAASNIDISVTPNAAAVGVQGAQYNTSGAGGGNAVFRNLPIVTPQTIYYEAISSGGTPTFVITISGYDI